MKAVNSVLSGKTVSLFINGKNYATTKTNSEGKASFTLNYAPTNNCVINFAGDSVYGASNMKFNIVNAHGQLGVKAYSSSYKSEVTFNIKLTNKNNKVLSV